MHPFKRKLVERLTDRLIEPPNRIQIVAGPRQTGKTTLVKQACKEVLGQSKRMSMFRAVDNPSIDSTALLRDFDYGDQIIAAENQGIKADTRWLVDQWQKARAMARSEKYKDSGYTLVLDEIQKIPDWSEAVKGLWDDDHSEGLNLHVVLLGSSPLLMQQGLSESLMGRYEVLESYHWSYLEMSEAFGFDIDEYIYFGGYPGAATYIRDEPRWQAYVQNSLIDPFLIKDIMVLARIDKPVLLKNAFELSCEYSGQIISLNKMKGQLHSAGKGNETTIAHYLDLLFRVGVVAGIQKYSGSKIMQRASSPKLNVMNTGLMACYSGYSFEQARADRTYWGRMVESSVGAHLLNTAGRNCTVYYWRDRGSEVDFVVERNKKLLAIEVKSSEKAKNIHGLNKFIEKYKNAKKLLVGASGISLQEFMSYPIDHWFDE